jgi:hypothetical protein
MMKHGIMGWIGWLSWVITALASINLGLRVFNYDFFSTDFMMGNMSQLTVPMHYLFLIAGLVSLAFFVMSAMGHCGCQGKCNCK